MFQSQLLTLDYYEIEKNTHIYFIYETLFQGCLVIVNALIYMASYQEEEEYHVETHSLFNLILSQTVVSRNVMWKVVVVLIEVSPGN